MRDSNHGYKVITYILLNLDLDHFITNYDLMNIFHQLNISNLSHDLSNLCAHFNDNKFSRYTVQIHHAHIISAKIPIDKFLILKKIIFYINIYIEFYLFRTFSWIVCFTLCEYWNKYYCFWSLYSICVFFVYMILIKHLQTCIYIYRIYAMSL